MTCLRGASKAHASYQFLSTSTSDPCRLKSSLSPGKLPVICRAMRIGIVTDGHGFAGGLERYSWMVALGLKKRGHSLRLLYRTPEGRDPDEFSRAFSDTSLLGARTAISDLDVIFAQRVETLEALKPFGSKPLLIASHDHSHTCIKTHRYLLLGDTPCHRPPGMGCVVRGCVLGRTRDVHGKSHLEVRNPFERRKIVREIARRALLVACSGYVADQLKAAGVPAGRVRVVHPIPQEDTTPLVPRPEAKRLIVAAQLVRGKGVDFAVDALRHLPNDVTLTVVGEGPSRVSLEKQAREVAPQRVSFTGYVPPEEVTKYYDSARVVLVPSRWPEPFGMVGIEAMRRARPIVAADHGGIPEWAPRTGGGRLFQPGSAEELALAALEILHSNDAGQLAFDFTTERHRHSDMLDQVESLLEEQVAGPS